MHDGNFFPESRSRSRRRWPSVPHGTNFSNIVTEYYNDISFILFFANHNHIFIFYQLLTTPNVIHKAFWLRHFFCFRYLPTNIENINFRSLLLNLMAPDSKWIKWHDIITLIVILPTDLGSFQTLYKNFVPHDIYNLRKKRFATLRNSVTGVVTVLPAILRVIVVVRWFQWPEAGKA